MKERCERCSCRAKSFPWVSNMGEKVFTPETQCKVHCLFSCVVCSQSMCAQQSCVSPLGEASFNFMSTFAILNKIRLPQD